ncbi:MAG: DUF1707 domain-containing protein [Actinomycetota bacterium]|nr:DUF1707 domain-containing protein [Actinomycetota bacterium]
MTRLPPGRRQLRASDAERDAVVHQLRDASAAGRLELSETTERIERALESKTLGELDDLVADLPPASDSPAPPSAPISAWRSPRLWSRAIQLVILNAFCLAIWAPKAGHGFWPAWVLLASALWFARSVTRQLERERRRQRRALRRTLPPRLDR